MILNICLRYNMLFIFSLSYRPLKLFHSFLLYLEVKKLTILMESTMIFPGVFQLFGQQEMLAGNWKCKGISFSHMHPPPSGLDLWERLHFSWAGLHLLRSFWLWWQFFTLFIPSALRVLMASCCHSLVASPVLVCSIILLTSL